MILVASDGFDNIISKYEGLAAGGERAAFRALNRAIGAARTVEKRSIASDTGMKQADVVAVMTMSSAFTGHLTATLRAPLAPLGVYKFKPRGLFPSRGKGATASWDLGRGRTTAPGAFIATMSSGHTGIFVRMPDKFMQKQKDTWKKKRQAIRELMGPSIGHVFIKFQSDAIARAEEIFVSNFEHEMSGQWGGTPVPSDPGVVPDSADV